MKINELKTKDKFFIENGYYEFPSFFDKQNCKNLLEQVIITRDYKKIFLTLEEYKNKKKQKGNNPRPGRNLAGVLDTNFVFGSSNFQKTISHIMGDKFRILDYVFVMGIPRIDVPKWIIEDLGDAPISNLGQYVQEKYQDITYLSGIDFHQDIIDYPYKHSNFLTAYIYLDDVEELSSPLYLLPKSHTLGATVFPHDLGKISDRNGNDKFLYKNNYGDSVETETLRLTGPGGSLYLWHSNLLHGTQPNLHDEPRISLRILVEKHTDEESNCALDNLNKVIKGSLKLTKTRRDIEEKVKGNFINKSV
jgi:hypothetical protein|tara:strand:- start:56 stop:973 length:918 start_codon:yes stop_codon:yes gene_type:complete